VTSRLLTNVLRAVRRTIGLREAQELTDADLLWRFAHDHDEPAFATLMHRHGPLVLGVCLRVLHDPHDADDAFQATFFVLARKAGSIGQPDRLANWLYGVALRVAKKAHAAAARRRALQQQVSDVPAAEPSRDDDWADLRQVLDDEVQRLPEKFRLPILLCYLEGRTREEAAQQLGWSAGAVKGMLERARELLRSRLTRRGVTLSAVALAGLLSEEAQSAAVPAALGDSTIKAALLFAAGKAAPAGTAAALAEGVLRAMGISRLKVTVAALLALVLVGTGAGVLALGRTPREPDVPKKAEPAPRADEKAEQLKRQASARLDLARDAYELYWLRYQNGLESEQTVNLWSRRWLQAQLDSSDKKADRDAALAAHVKRLEKVDEIARARLDLGGSPKPVGSLEEELKNSDTVFEQFMHREATTEQVCHSSARLLMAHQAYRKEVIKTLDVKDPNAQPIIDKMNKDFGFDLKDEKSEYQAHLDRLKKVEEITRARVEAGVSTTQDQDTATFYRLQAEEWLTQKKTFPEDVLNPDSDRRSKE
jgi:RNA polymerase sigma factor (sigma-70 family)